MTTFYSALYDIPTLNVVWHLGSLPVLTWHAPQAKNGVYYIWRAEGADSVWEDAVAIAGPLPITTLTYTDGAPFMDGISNVYWVVAYSPDHGLGGIGGSVLAVTQDGAVTGGATGSPAQSSDLAAFPSNLQFIDTVPWPGGTAEGHWIGDVTGYTPGSPTGPTSGPSTGVGWGIGWNWSNPAPSGFVIAPSTPVDLPGSFDSGVVVAPFHSPAAKAIPATVGWAGFFMQFPTGGATDPPYTVPGSFSATMLGDYTFEMTYYSGQSEPALPAWPGSVPNGDVVVRPPGPPNANPIPLSFPGGSPLPVMTSLPCIPCCWSACPCMMEDHSR